MGDMAPVDGRKALALHYCALAQEGYATHYAQKIHFAQLARKYGATHQEIATEYGVTEGAVRKMLQRLEEDVR